MFFVQTNCNKKNGWKYIYLDMFAVAQQNEYFEVSKRIFWRKGAMLMNGVFLEGRAFL
jgi:hypothetical protein